MNGKGINQNSQARSAFAKPSARQRAGAPKESIGGERSKNERRPRYIKEQK
jgi:hypothetical protein